METDGGYSRRNRLQATREVIAAVARATRGKTILTFPGGWVVAGSRRPNTILDEIVGAVGGDLRDAGSGRVSATLGIDGRAGADQLAVAITTNGIVAMARKFHPAPGEREFLCPAEDWTSGENGFPRIAALFERRFFLAVCYDGFGIKHRRLPWPKVDAVLDLVHAFGRRGSAHGSGDALFARHGLAGASQEWGVPTFAAAQFVDRTVPPDWPSGVRWKGRRGSTMAWRYFENGIAPERVVSTGTAAGRAVVRIFPPLAPLR
jgi:hypothetical protein